MVVGLQLVVGQVIDLDVLVSTAPGILQMLLFLVSLFADMADFRGLMFADVRGLERGRVVILSGGCVLVLEIDCVWSQGTSCQSMARIGKKMVEPHQP